MVYRHLITAIGLCIIFWPPILELYSSDQDESNYREIQPDQHRIAITFSKATKQDDFPQPYSIIDSLFLEFQGWLFQYPGYTSTVHPEGYKYWDESDIPYDLMW